MLASALLKDMVAGVSGIGYQSREKRVTADAAADHIDRGWDTSMPATSPMLFAEAARSLGFGARIIRLFYNPDLACTARSIGAGRIGVGSGLDSSVDRDLPRQVRSWITFDPTSRLSGGVQSAHPLAVGRVIAQVMPMASTFLAGETDAYLGMSVDVEVTPLRLRGAPVDGDDA